MVPDEQSYFSNKRRHVLPDGVTNVGYMKNFSHVNSPRLGTNYNAVLAFNRVDATVPDVQIIDLKCQDFGRLKV